MSRYARTKSEAQRLGDRQRWAKQTHRHSRLGLVRPPVPWRVLWLDDDRDPKDQRLSQQALRSLTWAKTSQEAIALLKTGEVLFASLDHDLGACEACMGGRTVEQWMDDHDCEEMPNCEHFGTGYTVLCWMEEHDVWPSRGVRVHTYNASARVKMEAAVRRHYGRLFS